MMPMQNIFAQRAGIAPQMPPQSGMPMQPTGFRPGLNNNVMRADPVMGGRFQMPPQPQGGQPVLQNGGQPMQPQSMIMPQQPMNVGNFLRQRLGAPL